MSQKALDNSSSRKTDRKYSDPIDNILVDLSDTASPAFKSMNYTPNGLTTLSLIFGAAAMYQLYNKELVQFSIYAGLSYFFDVMDGHYARKYGMVSDNGDKYDHIKDLVIVASALYILYSKYNITDYPVLIIVILAFMALSIMHTGCIERMTKHKQSDTMSLFRSFVPSDKETCKKYASVLKMFGPGVLIVFMIGVVWYLNSQGGSSYGVLDINLMNNAFPMYFAQDPAMDYNSLYRM